MVFNLGGFMRHRLLTWVLFALTIAMLARPTFADWDPGDPYKMHFPQLPDTSRWAISPTDAKPVADDWLCTETGWVKGIHFWGAFRQGTTGGLLGFRLKIYSDIPASPPGDIYSHPGSVLWQSEIVTYSVRQFTATTPQGFFRLDDGSCFYVNYFGYEQYNITLPDSLWFWQQQGKIYWLSIVPIKAAPGTDWGWQESPNHWNDVALYWNPDLIIWQQFTRCVLTTLDMAFVITGEAPVLEGCCLSDGSCADLVPADCISQGGQPQGFGSRCAAPRACCLRDGSCQELDPLCCDAQGGTPGWESSAHCQGDQNSNGVDDYCEGAVCYADGDCNNDGITLSVADMVQLSLFVNGISPATPPLPLYSGDLNGDGHLDQADVEVYECVFSGQGLACFNPYGGYPVAAPCQTDTVRGACCQDDTCFMRTGEGCAAAGGEFRGNGVFCSPVVCDTCFVQHPGDLNNDGLITSADQTLLDSYLYQNIYPPIPANADVNGDCAIDYADSKYLKAYLSGGPAPVECTCVYPLLCNCRVGDVNADRVLNVGDAVYVIGYIFKSGSGPTPYRLCSGDANCDCTVNIGDAVYIINYVFKGGPPPCSCPQWLDACGAPLRE